MRIVRNIKDIPQLRGSDIYFDLETTGLDPHTDLVLIIVMSDGETTYAIDCTKVNPKAAFRAIETELTTKRVIGHNLSFDWKFAFHHDVTIVNTYCTLIAERMLHAGLHMPVRNPYGLAAVLQRRFGVEMEKETRNEFIGGFSLELQDYHFEYAIKDVLYLPKLVAMQTQDTQKYQLERVASLEASLVPVTALMEYTGIGVDYRALESLLDPFTGLVRRSHQMVQDVFIEAGTCDEILVTSTGYSGFNLNSPKAQVVPRLNMLGVDVTSLDKKDVIRWDMLNSADEIDYRVELEMHDEDLADAIDNYEGLRNPYLRAISFARTTEKLLSFIEKLLERTNKEKGRVYGWYNQLGAMRTGRYSSNMQQIPKDDKLERISMPYSIRKCFKPSEGRSFIIADYSGIELVILAEMSRDEGLKYGNSSGDMHIAVVKGAFPVLTPLANDITPQNKKQEPYLTLRNAAKMFSYATAYGATESGLAEQLTIALSSLAITVTKPIARKILETWKTETFPKAGAFLTKSSTDALRKGYTTSVLGRRRWYDLEYAAQEKWKRLAIAREASNQPIQSTSADMTKLAMVYLYQALDITRARIVATVHDELIVETVDSYAETARQLVKECMERAAKELLPFMAEDISIEAHISKSYDK